MPFTIGVIGTNHPHAPGHFQSLQQNPNIERMLLWEPDSDIGRATCEQYPKLEIAECIEQTLDPQQVNAIVVLLPTIDAGKVTLRAIEHGLYVYADKPGAIDSAKMQEICLAAERTGAHYCPCYPWRVDSMTREIKQHIEAGHLGDIWSFTASFLTSQVTLRGADQWLFSRAQAGGGIVSWLACHWIDLLAYLLGQAQVVSGMVNTCCDERIDVEDVAVLSLRLPGGGVGNIRAGYVHNPFYGYEQQDISISFEGSMGSIYWPLQDRIGYRLRSGHPDFKGVARRWIKLEYDSNPREMYAADFLQSFLTAVETRTLPPATEQDALYVIKVLEAAYASSAQKVQINID